MTALPLPHGFKMGRDFSFFFKVTETLENTFEEHCYRRTNHLAESIRCERGGQVLGASFIYLATKEKSHRSFPSAFNATLGSMEVTAVGRGTRAVLLPGKKLALCITNFHFMLILFFFNISKRSW